MKSIPRPLRKTWPLVSLGRPVSGDPHAPALEVSRRTLLLDELAAAIAAGQTGNWLTPGDLLPLYFAGLDGAAAALWFVAGAGDPQISATALTALIIMGHREAAEEYCRRFLAGNQSPEVFHLDNLDLCARYYGTLPWPTRRIIDAWVAAFCYHDHWLHRLAGATYDYLQRGRAAGARLAASWLGLPAAGFQQAPEAIARLLDKLWPAPPPWLGSLYDHFVHQRAPLALSRQVLEMWLNEARGLDRLRALKVLRHRLWQFDVRELDRLALLYACHVERLGCFQLSAVLECLLKALSVQRDADLPPEEGPVSWTKAFQRVLQAATDEARRKIGEPLVNNALCWFDAGREPCTPPLPVPLWYLVWQSSRAGLFQQPAWPIAAPAFRHEMLTALGDVPLWSLHAINALAESGLDEAEERLEQRWTVERRPAARALLARALLHRARNPRAKLSLTPALDQSARRNPSLPAPPRQNRA